MDDIYQVPVRLTPGALASQDGMTWSAVIDDPDQPFHHGLFALGATPRAATDALARVLSAALHAPHAPLHAARVQTLRLIPAQPLTYPVDQLPAGGEPC